MQAAHSPSDAALRGLPDRFTTSYLPLDIARGTPIAEPNPGPGDIYARLEELGYRLNYFEEEIRARMPSPVEVRTPRLAPRCAGRTGR